MEALRELRWMLPGALRLARHARNPVAGVRQVLLFLWLFGRAKAGRPSSRAFRVRGGYGDFWLRSHTEMLVLWEVFVAEDYAGADLPDAVDLIVDVGANIGASAAWLGDRYPGARIVAAEADPETAELARRNLEGRPAEVVPAAVADADGEITLYVADSWTSSTTIEHGRPVTVPAVTLDSLLERGGPRRLVKIDAEGAEHAILRASQRLPEIDYFTGEFHPAPGETWETMVATLDGFDVTGGDLTPDGRRTFSAVRRS